MSAKKQENFGKTLALRFVAKIVAMHLPQGKGMILNPGL
jgi:hypothetical protein